mgnify:CR=1 FL=1
MKELNKQGIITPSQFQEATEKYWGFVIRNKKEIFADK